MKLSREDTNKLISGGVTALAMLLAIIVCLAFGYDPPDPPIPEEGVEVNLGNSDLVWVIIQCLRLRNHPVRHVRLRLRNN